MSILIFDLETNGLLPELHTIHSLVIRDYETGQVYSCCDSTDYYAIGYGLGLLREADVIVGHNIIGYDLPAIKKLYPEWNTKATVRDTMVCSRLIWPEILNDDYRLLAKKPDAMPRNLMGRHSLESWGHRLNCHKGNFNDWEKWSPKMQEYCEQDVEVTTKLWELICSKEYSEKAITLEHEFARYICYQMEVGVPFDVKAARALYVKLAQRRVELAKELSKAFAPWYRPKDTKPFVPKQNNRRFGYVKGAACTKIELVEFNPASRAMIADRLIKLYGWKPSKKTEGGVPAVDESVLAKLQYPETKLLAEYLMLNKRIGQLAEGDKAWLKYEKDGRIHGYVNTNGTVTGRCTHSRPNLGQVPAVRVPYGKECRSLFYAPEGWRMLGVDASGLELRCLAHYMAAYDGGEYAQIILEGDIHTANQEAAGLPTRDNAKTFIYALIFGAGDIKLGAIVAPKKGKGAQRRIGKQLRKDFLNRIPALKILTERVQAAAKTRGYLIGLDGRRLHIRSLHSALNTLLQSAGAIIVKQATVNFLTNPKHDEIELGKDWYPVLHIHDEFQIICKEDCTYYLGAEAVGAFRQTVDQFGLRIPIDAEYKIGKNWAETH